MHPAEVILMARQMAGNVPEKVPERRYMDPPATPAPGATAAAAAGAIAAGVALAAWLVTRPRA